MAPSTEDLQKQIAALSKQMTEEEELAKEMEEMAEQALQYALLLGKETEFWVEKKEFWAKSREFWAKKLKESQQMSQTISTVSSIEESEIHNDNKVEVKECSSTLRELEGTSGKGEVQTGNPLKDVVKTTLVANQTTVEALPKEDKVQEVVEKAEESENLVNEFQRTINLLLSKNGVPVVIEKTGKSENSVNKVNEEPQIEVQGQSEAPAEVKTVLNEESQKMKKGVEQKLDKKQHDEVTKPKIMAAAKITYKRDESWYVDCEGKPSRIKKDGKKYLRYVFGLIKKNKFILIGRHRLGWKRTKKKKGKFRLSGLNKAKKVLDELWRTLGVERFGRKRTKKKNERIGLLGLSKGKEGEKMIATVNSFGKFSKYCCGRLRAVACQEGRMWECWISETIIL